MGFASLTEAEFVDTLNRYLLPSSPVRQEELLRGRREQLQQIKEGLSSIGRSIFVHGLRGVGKTSLAQTAAYRYQSSDADPVIVACDRQSNFFRLVQTVGSRLLQLGPLAGKVTKTARIQASLKFLTVEAARAVEQGTVPVPSSVDEAIGIVGFCGGSHSQIPVVVIDEFDRLPDAADRTLFGDFVKQIGDQGLEVKLIFCGVGDSLTDLLAGHESCFRYLAGIRLERLGFDPRMEIITEAAHALGVKISQDYLYRIAKISDGFPHYIHLIGTKILWDLFKQSGRPTKVQSNNFKHGVQGAVQDVEASLRSVYEKATQKYGNEYEHVLWAMADHPDLRRRSSDVYDSYCRIMAELKTPPLERGRFNDRMNLLKRVSHGEILKGTRQGWYEFREPVVRGYCRLRAEEAGVSLGREHPLEG